MSTETEGAGRRAFPTVEARSLDGRTLTLPTDLEGDLNLLAVAFHRHHQSDVDSWAGEFAAIECAHGVVTYEVPTISGRWGPARRFIDGGMAAAIKDAKVRAHTLTVYGDTSRMTRGLDLPDRDQIAVVLCDQQGEVAWFGRGPRRDPLAAELRTIAGRLAGHRLA